MQALEQIVKPSQPRKEIDVYGVDAIVLYTPTPKPPQLTPLGSGGPSLRPLPDSHKQKDFIQYGPDNVQRDYYGSVIGGTNATDFKPINPRLDGDLRIDLNKSTLNTAILRENIEPIKNTYIHHNRGPGRVEENIFNKIRKY